MQIFITGSPLETAEALDARRLNKQIIECRQILSAIDGTSKAWSNHPCVLMYRPHRQWVLHYLSCLEAYQLGNHTFDFAFSTVADTMRPPFHTEAYFTQMKRRLYTKNNEHYKQWSHLGESDVNWYFVDGEWRYYRDGHRLSAPPSEE